MHLPSTAPQAQADTWVVDMEYGVRPDGRPQPRCAVAEHLFTGEIQTRWLEGPNADTTPFAFDEPHDLIVFSATADLSCYDVLGWPRPESLVDAHVEFRCWTNGQTDKRSSEHAPARFGGLAAAMRWIGKEDDHAWEKEKNRDLALRGGPYSEEEKQQLLTYCQTDVANTCHLVRHMAEVIEWPQARLRGCYMQALTTVEGHGLPLDVARLSAIRAHQEGLHQALIDNVRAEFPVYDDAGRFRMERFAALIQQRGWDWPLTPSGLYKVDKDTFSDMAKCYPEITPLKELRKLLGQLGNEALVVDDAGRNRVNFQAFQTITGRNAPSTNRFILGLSKAFRPLLRPSPGMALLELDYQQQEFGIAAALSGDQAMMDAYRSGDPYLAFAKQTGAVPENATKASHPDVRGRYKATVLAVQYGMGAKSLARQIPCTEVEAQALLTAHRRLYRRFWQWLTQVEHCALEKREIESVFGWKMAVDATTKRRTLMNWPMQANGAEMLRLALTYCVNDGIQVIAPVHDALIIEVPDADRHRVAQQAQSWMRTASADVLPGFPLRVDCEEIRFPDHFPAQGDGKLWSLICHHLDQPKKEKHHDHTNNIPECRF